MKRFFRESRTRRDGLSLPLVLALVGGVFLMGSASNCNSQPPTIICADESVNVPIGSCSPIPNVCPMNSGFAVGDNLEFDAPPPFLTVQTTVQGTNVSRSICVDSSAPELVHQLFTYTYSVGGQWGVGQLFLTTENGLSVTASAAPSTISTGQTTQLSASVSGGVPPYRYAWTGDALSGATIPNPTADPRSSQLYVVHVSDSAGNTGTASVQVNVNLVLSINGNPLVIDPGHSAQLDVVVFGGTPPYTYTWTPAGALNSAAISNPIASPASTTTFHVHVTDSVGVSQDTGITITVTLHVSASATPPLITAGQSSTLAAIATGGSPPYSYDWTPATGLSQIDVSNPTATPPSTTTYTVTVIDAAGTMGTASTTLTVNGLSAPVCSFTLTLLSDGSVEADASASTSQVPIVSYEFTQIWNGDPAQRFDACFSPPGFPSTGCVASPTPWLYNWFGTSGDITRVRVVDANGNSASSSATVP